MAGIFPFLDIPISTNSKKSLETFREYAWDFENNQFKLINGAPLIVEGNEALKVWIYKALLTPRYRYLGYTWNYGNEMEGLIGSTFTSAAIQTEAERFVREALLISPYIKSVPTVEVGIERDQLTIDVRVETVYGEVDVSV